MGVWAGKMPRRDGARKNRDGSRDFLCGRCVFVCGDEMATPGVVCIGRLCRPTGHGCYTCRCVSVGSLCQGILLMSDMWFYIVLYSKIRIEK